MLNFSFRLLLVLGTILVATILESVAVFAVLGFAALRAQDGSSGATHSHVGGFLFLAAIIYFAVFLIGNFVYFLPSLVASIRQNVQFVAIFILNVLLGWSCIGWIVAMVLACVVSDKRT